MLTINTGEFMERPIMSTKSDFSFRRMINEIVQGEYTRCKNIKWKNHIEAKEFVQRIDFSSIPFSEETFNDLINSALKILYNK